MNTTENDLHEFIQEEFDKTPVTSPKWNKLLELKILSGFLNKMYKRDSSPEHIIDMETTILKGLEEIHIMKQ